MYPAWFIVLSIVMLLYWHTLYIHTLMKDKIINTSTTSTTSTSSTLSPDSLGMMSGLRSGSVSLFSLRSSGWLEGEFLCWRSLFLTVATTAIIIRTRTREMSRNVARRDNNPTGDFPPVCSGMVARGFSPSLVVKVWKMTGWDLTPAWELETFTRKSVEAGRSLSVSLGLLVEMFLITDISWEFSTTNRNWRPAWRLVVVLQSTVKEENVWLSELHWRTRDCWLRSEVIKQHEGCLLFSSVSTNWLSLYWLILSTHQELLANDSEDFLLGFQLWEIIFITINYWSLAKHKVSEWQILADKLFFSPL